MQGVHACACASCDPVLWLTVPVLNPILSLACCPEPQHPGSGKHPQREMSGFRFV